MARITLAQLATANASLRSALSVASKTIEIKDRRISALITEVEELRTQLNATPTRVCHEMREVIVTRRITEETVVLRAQRMEAAREAAMRSGKCIKCVLP